MISTTVGQQVALAAPALVFYAAGGSAGDDTEGAPALELQCEIEGPNGERFRIRIRTRSALSSTMARRVWASTREAGIPN